MEPVAISWLVASSSSPLVAVLALWTIYVFHTYRRRWRTVDLFLLAATSQELVMSVFTFCYAIISLINPPFRTPCNFTQWGLVATRTFQIATLTSMIVDRSLTVRWPYRYRFSVRRNQIRYHIAVLALVSVLVGVAAVFAKSSHRIHGRHCILHPAQWDVKYMVFLLCLYGLLVLVSLACAVQIEMHRSRHKMVSKLQNSGSFNLPECASPELPSANGMNSPLDTQSSTGSTRALHRPSRQASRRPYGRHSKGTSDLRWAPVAFVALLCFTLNHIPYMVLMSLATWSPYLWSPWHEAILAWLRLLEGLLVPMLLFCKDHSLHTALRRTFQRRSGALSPLVGDDGPFQMYFDKDHFRKRGTFGSVTPVGIITNYRRAPGKRRGKYAPPGLRGADAVLTCAAGEPLSKLSCADLTSLEMWHEEEEENFYATLSDDFSTFSCRSADESAMSEDVRLSEELYGGSFTTIANDDFEFHDTRPCGGEVRMRPALPPPDNAPSRLSFRDHLELKTDRSSNIPFDKSRDLFDFADQSEEDRKDPHIFMTPLPPPPSEFSPLSSEDSISAMAVKGSDKVGTISRHQKMTSYSMNDLDLIHSGMDSHGGEVTTFVLPVKSESTMSLYRLNVDRDFERLVSPSKSETNVNNDNNGDSGFGSGAQSSNPVWSGFLCRKPSDPFWNMRKPSNSSHQSSSAVLHPRMRKIPWITAWKKLDENSEFNKQQQTQQQDVCGWKENVMYADANKSNVFIRGTIDEEMSSDVSTPVYAGNDYNMDIFAKKSGVLLENAYGKIVRDQSGVQVNFYGSREDATYKGHDAPAVFCNNIDYRKDTRNENIYQPVNGFYNISSESIPKTDIYSARTQAVENVFCPSGNNSNIFNCELRLNGGHYENLFGTKENIFARCDQYYGRSKPESGLYELSNKVPSRVERRSSDLSRKDSGRFKRSNKSLSVDESGLYGQLQMAERKDSVHRRNEVVKTKETNSGLSRKDSSSNKCGIKRKESKNKDDRKNSAIVRRESKERKKIEVPVDFVDLYKSRIEVKMQEDHSKNDLSRRNSQSRIIRPEIRNNLSPTRKRSSEQQENVNIELSRNSQSFPEQIYGEKKQARLERKRSQNRKQSDHENANQEIDRDFGYRVNYHRENPEGIYKVPNEGLWVNSEPFVAQNLNEVSNGSGDLLYRESKKDMYDLQRSSRDMDVPAKSELSRKESKTKSDRPKGHIRRKTSSRGKRYNSEPTAEIAAFISDEQPRGVKRKESGGRKDRPEDIRWNHQSENEHKHEDMANFIKYRDKIEGNFSHIQNVNRETSNERETSRLENLIYSGKSNVEVFPFDTFQEPMRVSQFGHRTVLDVNDNNFRQKKLAITDFL